MHPVVARGRVRLHKTVSTLSGIGGRSEHRLTDCVRLGGLRYGSQVGKGFPHRAKGCIRYLEAHDVDGRTCGVPVVLLSAVRGLDAIRALP